MTEIEYFKFEITPWIFDDRDPRPNEWRIQVAVNGERYDCTKIMPRIPFNKPELELYLREALAEFAKAATIS